MPVLIPCRDLQPKQQLAEPIRQSGCTLMSADKLLTPADVGILAKRFPDVLVRVVDPLLDELVEFEDDAHEIRARETVANEVAQAVAQVIGPAAQQVPLSYAQLDRLHQVASETARFLENHFVSAVVPMREVDEGEYLPRHAGKVFFLSMLLGVTVREYVLQERLRQLKASDITHQQMLDLTPLAVGAICMDLGMAPLRELYRQDRPLTGEEQELVRGHPQAGAELLPDNVSLLAQTVVRTHHESHDGNGYPEGLAAERLHVFSRIVRIADAFDAATSTRVYQRAKSPARALWEMTEGPYQDCYDPVLMKVFARLIQPYPIGAKLRLTDGRYVLVVRYNRQQPFRPQVVIAFDQDGKHLPADQLDGPFEIGERDDVQVGSFWDEDLSYIYGPAEEQAHRPAPAHGKDFSTLFDAVYP